MGFSLKMFFADLEKLLASNMKQEEKLAALTKLVAEAKEYAEQCGKL